MDQETAERGGGGRGDAVVTGERPAGDASASDVGGARSPWAVLNRPAIWLILAYKATLSPFLGSHCRFHPTCSTYALEAYRRHNPLRATGLTAWRLLRCQPLGGRGVDPVPAYRGRSSGARLG